MADPDRNAKFASLFGYFAYICEFVYFLCAMVYLKTITAYLRDMLLAGEPVTIYIQFIGWHVAPQILGMVLLSLIDYRKIEMFEFMVLGAFGLFCLVAFIFSVFLTIKLL